MEIIVQFHTAIIKSIITFSITIWYMGATSSDRHRLQRIVLNAETVNDSNLGPVLLTYMTCTPSGV